MTIKYTNRLQLSNFTINGTSIFTGLILTCLLLSLRTVDAALFNYAESATVTATPSAGTGGTVAGLTDDSALTGYTVTCGGASECSITLTWSS